MPLHPRRRTAARSGLSRARTAVLATAALAISLAAVPSAPAGSSAPTGPGQAVTGTVQPRAAAPGPSCGPRPAPARFADATGEASVSVLAQRRDCRRTYRIRSSMEGTRRFTEPPGVPLVRTGSALVDGLYALANVEARLNRARKLEDAAYNDGKPVICLGGCYVTGANWPYVWTRDVAYSADLGLTALDPLRMRNTLRFKLSDRRDGEPGAQIIQDTGTGGSYPNSTDRVSWVLGALEVMDWLPPAQRAEFAARTRSAVVDTVEHDRAVVFDARTGLYRGETSFLDWREQTYPAWTAKDVTDVTESMSLSTNLLHWVALDAAARLSQAQGSADAAKYRAWADELAGEIRSTFWREDVRQFSHVLPSELDPTPVRRYDALATSLAVLTGVATPRQARAAVKNYPQTSLGPPVIWPQQQGVPAYHNNAVWPFVTAYLMRAAARTGNDTLVTTSARSLLRGGALYTSHMENIDVTDGSLDTEMNSERQLWSVAGMQSMIQQTVFGLDARPDGLHVRPFLPAQLHRAYFAKQRRVRLQGLDYRGREIDVEMRLPGSSASRGAYEVRSVTLNGRRLPLDAVITTAMLRRGTSQLVVVLGPPAGKPAARISYVDRSKPEALYGPRTPRVSDVQATPAGGVRLVIDTGAERARRMTMSVHRDGTTVAQDIAVTETWVDPDADTANRSPCYTVSLTYRSSRNSSHNSRARCFWGEPGTRVQTVRAADFQAVGGRFVTDPHGPAHYADWGSDPGDSLTALVTPESGGEYLLQADYALDGPINTGITGAVKMLRVIDDSTGDVVAQRVIALPHTGADNAVNGSTFARARLSGGTTYRIVLENDPLAINMSYFTSNALHEDARSGPVNDVDVFAMKAMLVHRE